MTGRGAPRAGLVAWAAPLLLLIPAVAPAGDGVVALQTAEASCDDGSGAVYVDCGNGTVTDTRSGLVWLAEADCFGAVTWEVAMQLVAGLADLPPTSVAAAHDCGLADGSSPGEWRLASKSEWQEMIAAADPLGCAPAITADDGLECWSEACHEDGGCAFSGVQFDSYWSANTHFEVDWSYAWFVNLQNATLQEDPKELHFYYVWPVRGGQ